MCCCWVNDGGHTLLEQCVAHRTVLVQYLTYLAYGNVEGQTVGAAAQNLDRK